MIAAITGNAWRIVSLCLFGLLVAQTLRLQDARQDHAQAIATVATERATVERQVRQVSEKYRSLEKEYRESIDKIAAVGNAGIERAAADADRARTVGQRLQRELADYLDTHRRALEAGDTEAGCTVHHVVAEMDAGPIIAQVRVPILGDDTPESVAARVLAAEHRLYPSSLVRAIEKSV